MQAFNPRTLQAYYTPQNRKPGRWDVRPGETAAYDWMQHCLFLAPWWANAGQSYDIIGNGFSSEEDTNDGTTSDLGWTSTEKGIVGRLDKDRIVWNHTDGLINGHKRLTLVAVARVVVLAGGDSGIFGTWAGSASTERFQLVEAKTADAWRFFVRKNGVGTSTESSIALDTDFHVFIGTVDDTATELFVDGVSVATGTTGSGAFTDADALRQGEYFDDTFDRTCNHEAYLTGVFSFVPTLNQIKKISRDPFAFIRPALNPLNTIAKAAIGGTTFEGSVTLASSYTETMSNIATLESDITVASAYSTQFTNIATLLASVTFNAANQITPTEILNALATTSLAHSQTTAFSNDVTIEGAVSLSLSHQQTVETLWTAFADITENTDAAISLETIATLEAAITYASSSGATFLGGANIAAALTYAFSEGISASVLLEVDSTTSLDFTAQQSQSTIATLGADQSVGFAAALALVNDAITGAGLSLDHITSVTLEGSTLFIGISNPVTGEATVTVEVRTASVDSRSSISVSDKAGIVVPPDRD